MSCKWIFLATIVYSQVTSEVHILTEDTDDQWGNHFVQGTSVIQGLYFDRKKQLSTNEGRTYKLIKNQKAIVHSAAVVFLLAHSQNSDILQLSEHDHLDIVHTAMALLQQLSRVLIIIKEKTY